MALHVFAPAKVNLHLAVGPVGDDGYHPVETVLQALAFGDTVTLTPSTGFELVCVPTLGIPAEANIAFKAAHAMSARYDRALDVAIAIEKRIPAGAGLGGASADAAATILGLATLWGVPCDDPGLTEVSRALGADVPFFLNGGAALFAGRGDVLVRTLRALDAPVVLLKPASPVLTAQAYRAFDQLEQRLAPPVDRLIAALESGDQHGVSTHLFNAMTSASMTLVPEISGALRLVSESHGVIGSIMAGSGSAVFGICSDDDAAEACVATARAAGLWAVATRTRPGGCNVEAV